MPSPLDILRPDLDGFNSTAWPDDRQGWGSTAPIFQRLIARVRPRLIVEVGTWKGASALHMAACCDALDLDCPIVCVDTWLGAGEFIGVPFGDAERGLRSIYGWPQVYYQFLANVVTAGQQDRIIPFPQTSLIAARWLYQQGVRADLIYIDGSHDAADVTADIAAYSKLLSGRGVLFGDDFDCWPDVRRAVQGIGRAFDVEDGRYWVLR